MSRPSLIQPRTLKGFRDYLPETMVSRQWLLDTARAVFRSFGFAAIDTPSLEYTEILLGKGGDETDKQLYRFTDHGGRDVALRFDLTIPFARFAAQHMGQLGTPFKRYHMGTVWRGENTQRGRYREFLQCDFDLIGTTSLMADVEIALVIHELFSKFGFERFTIHLNDRRVLNGVLERLELTDVAEHVLRALDKLGKIGPEKVAEEMTRTAGASAEQAQVVLELARLEGTNEQVLASLQPLAGDTQTGRAGLEALGQILAHMRAAGVPQDRVRLDVSIARGLDYYTGPVFETTLDELEGIGSCCSGGRYDDLATLYTKQHLPGTGASLGLDRLLAAMQELGRAPGRGASAPVFVPYFDADRGGDYLALAAELRAAGLDVEVYPEPKKLGVQLKYADRRGHRLAVIVGEQEWEAGTCQLKDLSTKVSREVPRSELAAACKEILGE